MQRQKDKKLPKSNSTFGAAHQVLFCRIWARASSSTCITPLNFPIDGNAMPVDHGCQGSWVQGVQIPEWWMPDEECDGFTKLNGGSYHYLRGFWDFEWWKIMIMSWCSWCQELIWTYTTLLQWIQNASNFRQKQVDFPPQQNHAITDHNR